MSNYHVYISIISKPRYTSTASCWFTIWKLNKLVVKRIQFCIYQRSHTSLHLQQVIAQPEHWAHPEGSSGSPRSGTSQGGTSRTPQRLPPAQSHLCQPSTSQWAATAESSLLSLKSQTKPSPGWEQPLGLKTAAQEQNVSAWYKRQRFLWSNLFN